MYARIYNVELGKAMKAWLDKPVSTKPSAFRSEDGRAEHVLKDCKFNPDFVEWKDTTWYSGKGYPKEEDRKEYLKKHETDRLHRGVILHWDNLTLKYKIWTFPTGEIKDVPWYQIETVAGEFVDPDDIDIPNDW